MVGLYKLMHDTSILFPKALDNRLVKVSRGPDHADLNTHFIACGGIDDTCYTVLPYIDCIDYVTGIGNAHSIYWQSVFRLRAHLQSFLAQPPPTLTPMPFVILSRTSAVLCNVLTEVWGAKSTPSSSVTGSASTAHMQVSNPGYEVYTIYGIAARLI